MFQQRPLQRVSRRILTAAGGVGLSVAPGIQIAAAGQQEAVAVLRHRMEAGNSPCLRNGGTVIFVKCGIAGDADFHGHGTTSLPDDCLFYDTEKERVRLRPAYFRLADPGRSVL